MSRNGTRIYKYAHHTEHNFCIYKYGFSQCPTPRPQICKTHFCIYSNSGLYKNGFVWVFSVLLHRARTDKIPPHKPTSRAKLIGAHHVNLHRKTNMMIRILNGGADGLLPESKPWNYGRRAVECVRDEHEASCDPTACSLCNTICPPYAASPSSSSLSLC